MKKNFSAILLIMIVLLSMSALSLTCGTPYCSQFNEPGEIHKFLYKCDDGITYAEFCKSSELCKEGKCISYCENFGFEKKTFGGYEDKTDCPDSLNQRIQSCDVTTGKVTTTIIGCKTNARCDTITSSAGTTFGECRWVEGTTFYEKLQDAKQDISETQQQLTGSKTNGFSFSGFLFTLIIAMIVTGVVATYVLLPLLKIAAPSKKLEKAKFIFTAILAALVFGITFYVVAKIVMTVTFITNLIMF